MKQEEKIREAFDGIQRSLDGLQGMGATCLFIADEGNRFVVSGSPLRLTAQLVFAMCRYPVVRDIVRTAAERFEDVDGEHGDKARSQPMDHLIERNSGN